VLLKGGHLAGEHLVDVYCDAHALHRIEHPRLPRRLLSDFNRAGKASTQHVITEGDSMKAVWIISLLLLTRLATAAEAPTPFPMVEGKINFSEIVPVAGASKSELYARAKLWFANAFVAANHVIQLDDKETGVLIGKGSIISKDSNGKKTWEFTVKIQTKEERYKAEIYDISYKFENDLSRVSPAVRAILEPESVTYFNLDQRFADRTSRKSMYDKHGNLKKGFATNVALGANQEFPRLLASIRKQLSEGVALDDF
jgi:hypothetical protein